jgi:hypothetical protein
MNDILKNITLEELDNPDNGITANMLFSDDNGKIESQEVPVDSLRALLSPIEAPNSDLKSLLDKSPMDEFLSVHSVGLAFSAEMYEAGKGYIKDGLSIIPVGKDKRPLIKWLEFQERKATEAELKTWLQTFADMQLGCVTGKISNLIVVDIDKPDLDLSWLPTTAIAKTGSGGMHYYYSFVEGFTNKTRIKEFIDIRASGGYVVLPPSCNLKGKYEWVKRVKPVIFPINLFQQEQEVITKEQVKTEYSGFGEGQRNQEMAKYIGHILARVHPIEWDSIAYPVIQDANTANRPPLNDFELRTIFDSICSREKRSNTARWYNREVEQIKKNNFVDNLTVKNDYKLRYTWGTRSLDTTFSIIKRGNFIVLGAKSGSGKTTFAFDMAMKNALLGHKILFLSLEMDETEVKNAVARKKSGMTIEEELDYNIPENKQLIFENKVAEIDSIKNLFFEGVRRGGGLRWEEILDIIYKYNDLDMIIIDNLDLIEGERGENDLDRQKRVVKKIMGFTSEKRVPIVLIHHYRKIMGKEGKVANIDDLSGSKKICDGADRVLNISRNNKLDADYPAKYQSIIYLQKGREYDDAIGKVYFIRGTFVDEKDVPTFEDYCGAPDPRERKIFGVDN